MVYSYRTLSDILSEYGANPVCHTSNLLQLAAEDPGLKEVYRDAQAVLLEVIAP
jgi:hypothetical protein